MKVFQIIDGYCHWDATALLGCASEAAKRFPADAVFADAPDYVFEGWSFDSSLEGDARFIRPEAPAGWLYDDASGTFYEEGGGSLSDKKISAAELGEMICETQNALCELFELISAVGKE